MPDLGRGMLFPGPPVGPCCANCGTPIREQGDFCSKWCEAVYEADRDYEEFLTSVVPGGPDEN
jgi:hypothetical protein